MQSNKDQAQPKNTYINKVKGIEDLSFLLSFNFTVLLSSTSKSVMLAFVCTMTQEIWILSLF